MSQVAARAGVAVGTIYRHFPSKEAIGNAVYQRWKARFGEYLVAAEPASGPVREAFGRVWGSMLRFAADHPDAFVFLDLQQHASYLDEESRSLSERMSAPGLAVIERGQAEGVIRPGEPVVLAVLVYGAFIGLAATRRVAAVGADQLAVAEEAVWHLLSGPAHRPPA